MNNNYNKEFYKYYLYTKKSLDKLSYFVADSRFEKMDQLKENGTNRLVVGDSTTFDSNVATRLALSQFYRMVQKKMKYKLEYDKIDEAFPINTKSSVALVHMFQPYRIEFKIIGTKFTMYLIYTGEEENN